MLKFKEFINEEACATMGNSSGMGNVVSAQPSSTPGSVNASDATVGSGDIGQGLGTAYTKPEIKMKKKKKRRIKKYENFDSNEIDNFTARYYDNYDDEEDQNNYNENSIEALKKIQMFEKDKKTNK